MMIITSIRILALWAFFAFIIQADKATSLAYAMASLIAIYFITWLALLTKQQINSDDGNVEILEEHLDDPNVITGAGKTCARYFDKEYPLWLEVNGRDMYVFNGQSEVNTDITVTISADEFVLPPHISYKLLCAENQDYLAKNLGISVAELTSFDHEIAAEAIL